MPPRRVFAAFSDLSLRARWFRIPGSSDVGDHDLDFRVGGGEVMSGVFAPAEVEERIEYRSHFFDIATDERIVFACELVLDGRRRSVSLVAVELTPDTGGTRLTYTEQYAFVSYAGDGSGDIAERQGGTRLLLNRLGAVLAQAPREETVE